MPPETLQIARWKRVVGYVAFGISCFVFFLYLTFPYDVIKQRAIAEAAAAGWTLTMGSLGPGFFGVTATDVRLSKATPDAAPRPPPAEGGAPEATSEPLLIPKVSARPSLFPLGVALSARVFGGKVSGAVGGLRGLSASLYLDGLDPSKGNFKAVTGMDLAGTINGSLSLSMPRADKPSPQTGDFDLGAANGSLSLDADKVQIKGGTLTIPIYGQPTPVDLPRIALGDITGRVKIDKGLATIEKLLAKGSDVELQAGGTVKLNRRPDYSELNLDLKIKTEQEFRQRLGMIASGLSILPPDKDNPDFRVARVTGPLGRPNMGPGQIR